MLRLPGGEQGQSGKTSPSFLIAVLLVILIVAGFAGWRFLRPDPFRESEMIVRESRRVLNGQVRDFEQELRDLMTKAGLEPAARIAAIEQKSAGAKVEIDRYLDEARAELSELDIPLKTHKNRADRLGEKAEEAKQMIDERVAEKREQLAGG